MHSSGSCGTRLREKRQRRRVWELTKGKEPGDALRPLEEILVWEGDRKDPVIGLVLAGRGLTCL